MEISYVKKSRLESNNYDDFVSTHLEDDEQELAEIHKKKKLTIIGLSTFYIALILISFAILN